MGSSGNAETGLHGVTLRFPDSGAEMSYVRRKSGQLLGNFRKCCALLCGASLLGLGMNLSLSGGTSCLPWDCGARSAQDRVKMESTWAVVPFILLGVALAAATKTPCLARRVGAVWWEVIIVAAAMSTMAAQVISTPAYWCQLRGRGCIEAAPGGAAAEMTTLVLFLDLIVTGSHLALPIRWCALVPLQAGGVLLFTMVAMLLGSNERWLHIDVAFVTLTILASFGKRAMERQERQEFRRFMAEKALRLQMEFKLSQVADRGRAPGEDQHSVPGSAPSTTESGRAFVPGGAQPPDADSGGSGLLSAIGEVGLSEQWLIDARQVQLQPQMVLGEGSFGRVIGGWYCGTPVAVKLPKDSCQREPGSDLVALCNELRIIRRLRHPNIVSLFGALLDSEHGFLAVVLEMVEGVPLREFISPPRGGAADADRVVVLADVSSALWYLHTRRPPTVHGDLKDSNIFVEPRGLRERPCRAKLLDFGLSRAMTKHAKPLGGSLHWMAPEVIRREARTPSLSPDIFSFGRVAFFVVAGVHPKALMTRSCIMELAERGQLPQLRWPHEGDALTRSFRQVAERCCAFDPAARPHIAEVHPLFSAWLGRAGMRGFGGAGAAQQVRDRPQEAAAADAGGGARRPEEGSAGAASEPGAEGATEEYPRHAGFRPTPLSTQLMTLLDQMERWNIQVPQTSCCVMHALVSRLRSCCDELQKCECGSLRCSEVVGQCKACSVLVLRTDIDGGGDTGGECDHCGGEIELATLPA